MHDITDVVCRHPALWDIAKLLEALGDSDAGSRPHPLYLEALGTIFATHMLQSHLELKESPDSSPRLTPKQLRKAIDYIHVHMARAISISEIAGQVHLSPCHFIRLFKSSTGQSPHQYLIKCRVLRAQELLRTGDFRVAEVAHAVGFCDHSHLNRHFRRHFGFAPKHALGVQRASLI